MSPESRKRRGLSSRARQGAEGRGGQPLALPRGANERRPDPAPARRRSYVDWLDERDARLPAPPDRPVRLVSESGKTVAHTAESNAERMAAALEPRHGPLTVVPA